MSQEEYRSCMAKNMGGGRLKGLSKEDRRIEFCTIAKECSKGISYEEARPICAEAAANPKPPKARKARGKCTIDSAALASCVIKLINNTTNVSQLGSIIANCTGHKVGQKTKPIEPVNRKEFFKKCYKENPMANPFGSRAGFRELKQLQSMCTAKWNEQEAAI